jgi:hypothetical protein
MLLEKDGVLIEKVMGAGKPSLYGNNVATFAVELRQRAPRCLKRRCKVRSLDGRRCLRLVASGEAAAADGHGVV